MADRSIWKELLGIRLPGPPKSPPRPPKAPPKPRPPGPGETVGPDPVKILKRLLRR